MAHRRWVVRDPNPRAREDLARALGVSPLVSAVLSARGALDAEHVRSFLSPSVGSLPDPDGIPGMAAAAARVVLAAQRRETVWIYTDYDADGVTSAALLCDFFTASGIEHRVRLPRRDQEGYGLSVAALTELAAVGATLVVTADCGISAVAEARLARELGLDLVITDHHTPGPEVPEAVAVVNPKLPGSRYPDAMIAGVGVAWNLAAAVRRELRLAGLYAGREPDLRDLLDLVAIGTVADVVPLTGVNRVLVAAGLKRLNAGPPRPGVAALQAVASVPGPVRASHIAFQLAPRINAAGRMADAQEALRLLLASDAASARGLAAALDDWNRRRQDEERGIVDAALGRVKAEGWIPDRWSLVVDGADWHEGVLGIAASKLTEAFYRPTVVLSRARGRGSARSVQGLNLYEALSDCAGHLERFGGHAAAAGLRLPGSNVEPFREAFEAAVRRRLSVDELRPTLLIDAEVGFADLAREAVRELSLLEPFGSGNPGPLFVSRGVGVLDVRPVGRDGSHLKFRLEHGGQRFEALAWRKAQTLRHVRPGAAVDLAFAPEVNEWHGLDRVQLRVEGMRDAGG